jgi:hypothetical protein
MTFEPVPSDAPLLHRSCSPPLGLRHRETPHSGEPSPLFGCQIDPPPYRLALRPLHHRPPIVDRPDFVGKSSVPKGEKACEKPSGQFLGLIVMSH